MLISAFRFVAKQALPAFHRIINNADRFIESLRFLIILRSAIPRFYCTLHFSSRILMETLDCFFSRWLIKLILFLDYVIEKPYPQESLAITINQSLINS